MREGIWSKEEKFVEQLNPFEYIEKMYLGSGGMLPGGCVEYVPPPGLLEPNKFWGIILCNDCDHNKVYCYGFWNYGAVGVHCFNEDELEFSSWARKMDYRTHFSDWIQEAGSNKEWWKENEPSKTNT